MIVQAAKGRRSPLRLLAPLVLHAADAHAGDRAADGGGERGLLPSDLFSHLRRAANP